MRNIFLLNGERENLDNDRVEFPTGVLDLKIKLKVGDMFTKRLEKENEGLELFLDIITWMRRQYFGNICHAK